MSEEEVQTNSDWWDFIQRLRDIPMFSPQRACTGWFDDQVPSPPLDLFAVEREWASFPMYSPQRSPIGWCADQVLSPGRDEVLSPGRDVFAVQCEWDSFPMYSPHRSPTGCFPNHPEDKMLSNFLTIGNSTIFGNVSFIIYPPQRSPTGWCVDQEQSPEDKMHSVVLVIGNATVHGDVSFLMDLSQRSPTGWCADQVQSAEDKMHSNSLTIGNSKIFGDVSFIIYPPQRSPTGWCADQVHSNSLTIGNSKIFGDVSFIIYPPQTSPTGWCADQVHSNSLTIGNSKIFGNVSFIIYPPQRSPTDWCADQEQSPEDKMHSKSLTIGNSTIFGSLSVDYTFDGCSLVEPKILNNSVHQNSPGSKTLEMVRPLQQRHNGVMIRDGTDEQNVNLIPINEETERIESMARKRKESYVGERNENSQVRPLQQRNDGVVRRDDTDEQNVNLIPINEVQPLQDISIGVVFDNEQDKNVTLIHEETERIEVMARKRKATYVGEGNENSLVRPLQLRNDGVVIRDDTDEQNVNLIPINEVQPLQDINIGVVFGNELDQNVIHIHEETERIEVMARKRKATYVGEGNENSLVRPLQQRNDGVVIRDDTDEQNINLNPINEVQPLQDINIGVVFGNELDQNVIHIHEETERIEVMARKRKATYVGEGNKNSLVRPLQQRNDGVVIRDDTDEQTINLNPINEVQPLQDINIGVVFGNKLDQNVIHIHEETERIEVMARKRKATYVGEGNENSLVRPLQQRNDGVVIRDDTDEQNINLNPINEVQPLQDINIGVVFGNELDQNVIHIHEETERIEVMARKRKATYVGEGNKNSRVRPLQQRYDGVVIRDDTDEQNINLNPINEVQPLQDINIGVVFGNELDQNVIHIHEETERIEVMARKRKATYVGEGNKNSRVRALQQRNDGVVIRDVTGEQNVKLIPVNEGYTQEGGYVELDNLMGENIGEREKSCIAISHSKKENTTYTPKRKYKTKCPITLDDLRPLFGLKRAEAAKAVRVSVPTFKRYCRQNGITWWNGDGCSLAEPKLLNNSVHQNSPGSKPPQVEGEKVTVKAKYGQHILKFLLSLESGVEELNEAVAKRGKLELGSFVVQYEDEDQEWVLIACDEDLQECIKFSSSLGNRVIRLLVTDNVSNSEKSR